MTKLGGILDPLADKMLVLAGFLGLMVIDRADVWAVFLILSREFFITGLRVVAVAEGKNVASTMAGKVKTVASNVCYWIFNYELAICNNSFMVCCSFNSILWF